MVQCYTCSTVLNGNWSINTSNYTTGAYLGVDAYFAYNGMNWVYCFCSTCFNNGNYANYLKSWYPGPINQLLSSERSQITTLQGELASQKSQTSALQSQRTALQARVAQLLLIVKNLEEKLQISQAQKQRYQLCFNQTKTKMKQIEIIYDRYVSIFSPQYYKKLLQIQKYQNQVKLKSIQIHQPLLTYRKKLLNKNEQTFKQIIGECMNEIIERIEKSLKNQNIDYEKIKQMKKQTLSKMKEQKDLFKDQQMQKISEVFDEKIAKKDSQSKILNQFLEQAKLLKNGISQ